MFRSHSLDLSFIRRGRKRSSAARSASQTALRANVIVMAVSTAEVGSSKRSRGLADIDPKFVSKSGLGGVSEVGTPRGGSVRIQHRPPRPASTVQSRFPKLDECAHFHYEVVDLGSLTIQLSEEGLKCEENGDRSLIAVQVCSQGKSWIVRRSVDHFRAFDEQLHRCVYDRKFSLLPAIPDDKTITTQHGTTKAEVALRPLLSDYVTRLSCIAGNLINCAPVLNWLEVDNRGRRLIPPDDADINTPAVAAAYAVRRYAAQASDEITFEVGDMISVIDMPPPEESVWWRGKRGFDVGFFPYECVRVIGDKVPVHLSLPGASGAAVQPGDQCSSASSSSDSGTLPSKPVLRKHGKLISFFRSFILSRPSRRKLKQSGILKERVFGCDLGEHLLNSGKEIPMVLKCCAEFIEEYGIVDGIYRLSGVTSNIQKLRNTFDEDRVPSLEGDEAIRQDIHAVSSLLKMYFRELPNPLCTYQLYDQFVSAVQGPEDLRVVRMRAVVQQLPPPHYRTLEYLVRHLARVAEHNGSTGMTAKNVAIVWAPNLLRCKELEVGGVAALQGVGIQAVVTECLIKYVELIFSDKLPALPPPQLADNPRRSRPKSLAISAPTKLLSLEEARNRALQLAIQNDTQYIEVGGGPASLPTKYHTVIDLPKRGNSLKHKKSPSGWKSLFAKSRSPSSKHRKGSTASTGSTSSTPVITAHQSQRAVTYTRPKLRPVKSAESLSNRNSKSEGSPNQSSPMLATVDTPPPEIAAEENVTAEATPTRCHSRSVSHDSYFHLLQLNRNAMSLAVANPVDEEELTENGETSLVDDKYYEGLNLATGTDFSKEVLEGTEFGRGLKLAAVEDAVSSESKTSLNNLSHLDDSELNIMNSREMLAVSRRDDYAKPRQASSDDSAVANSSKAERKSPSPLNAEPLNDVETWVASNPAYELFCVQAEVHRQRNTPSPLSPDNTEAQVTDMTSEVAEDSDSLENVEECSLANATVSERESFTLHTNSVSNETYENFGEPSPGAGCYENVIDRSIVDEEYEPIETPTTSPSVHIEDVSACYENVEAPEAYPSNAGTCYENVEVPEANLSNAGTCYENVEVPEANLSNAETNYENVDSEESPGVSYENVECCTEAQLAGYELMSNEPTPSCEQIEAEEISGLYENVDLYEDVIPPPPASTATAQEDQVYQQVKVLRQSIQEVNEILKGDHYPHPNQSESLPPAVLEPQPAAVEEVVTTPVDESLPPAVLEPQPASVEEVATTPADESLPPAVPEPRPAAVEGKPATPSANDVVCPRSPTPKTVKEEGPRDPSPCRRPTKGPLIAPKPQIEPKKRPVFAKDVVIGDKEDAKSLSLSLPSLEHQAKPLKVVPDHTQSLPTTPAAPVNAFPASPQNKKTQSPVGESPPKRPTSLDAEAADSRLRRPCSRFGNERQPSVKELLNKFQSGSGSETLSSSNSSSDEKTKTSPTTPTSPLLLLHSSKEMEDTSETLEIKGKENIEISSIKDFANESKEDANKDDKTSATIVGVDMSDPRTRLRIERYKEERRSFLREKYKLEAFRADTKEDDVIVRLKMKAGSPTRPLESELLAQPDAQRPAPGLLNPEPGLIDEDVNVKERAALWSTSTTSSSSSPVKIPKRAEEKSEVKISSPEKVAPPQRRIKNIAAIFEKDSH